MVCKLCKQERAPKSNTHYLTDFIIRTALNEDGVNVKNKGLYYSFDPDRKSVGFKYQQRASPERLQEVLGRETTDDENAEAKEFTEFSVSDSFCKDCEDIFSAIENDFDTKLLKKFRGDDLTGVSQINLNEAESRILRLFFLMQFWRSSVCDDTFDLSENTNEFLRNKIFTRDFSDLELIPLSVTYLETLKDEDDTDEGDKYKTQNVVSPTEGKNPYIILMNDFVIQLYEDLNFPFTDFYGLNEVGSYVDFLNYKKTDFKVNVLSNAKRKIVSQGWFHTQASSMMENTRKDFMVRFRKTFGALPTIYNIADYMTSIGKIEDPNTFLDENFEKYNDDYFKNLQRK